MTDLKKGYTYNFLSVLMMAVGPLLSKFGLLHISPSKAAVINTIAIIFASFLWGKLTKRTVTFHFEKEIILLALFNSLGVIFLFVSMNLLSPVQVGFLGRFYTVFAVILSVLLLGERMTKKEISFIILAILGAFMFVNKGGIGNATLLGSIFALVYTFFFALTNIFIKKTLSKDKSSNSILFTNNFITLIFVMVYAVIFGDLFDSNYSVEGVSFIILSSVITGFIGTILLYEALKYLRFSIANVTRAFSPILLAIISFPFFPIELTILNITGAILLLLSILLLSLGDNKKRNELKKQSA
ncbi:EamA family transporter [Aquibacillus halophilus]|uniref:EamA family transporter n=1 Tax=Aquibacillus halophilus TaxID=930132 RepID=A0A6A8DAW5_9BACI|nr:EamA family transporter [Aquibacillus halophilus]MRH41696.1 EamA family transporter [Aquibacillus halophilus]